MRNNINSTIERFSQAARREQLFSPDMIQKTKAPSFGGGETTPGAAEIIYATVIESLVRANPESESLPNGRSYYTLRLLTDTTAVYNAETHYALNATALYTPSGAPAASLYKCILVDLPADPAEHTYQVGHQPDTSPTYWEKQDEIKVEKAIGKIGTLIDLRSFIPWYPVGQIVPVIEVGIVWYIDETLIYCGPDDSASLRWNETEGRAFACYK